MIESFMAKIGADIKDFMSKIKQVDAEVKKAATEATKPINADIAEFISKILKAENLAEAFEQPIEKLIQAEVAEFNRRLAEAQSKAEALAREQVQVQVDAMTAEFNRKLAEAQAKADEFAREQVKVQVDAVTTEFNAKMAQMQAEIAKLKQELADIPVKTRYQSEGYEQSRDQYRQYYRGISEETRKMQEEMKAAHAAQREAMRAANEDMIKAEHQYFKLAQGAKNFTGTNKEFMDSVKAAGAAHKAATDAMMKSNELMKQSLIQTAGTMLNMSTQASKISANYDRMGNSLLSINKGGLAAADGLNKLANAGSAAVLALKMLGPTADMKALNDMTMMITQGMMRFTMVGLAAAVTATLFYGALHKAAMENENYANSFNTMLSAVREALQPMVDVFTMVMTKVYDFITSIAQMVSKFNEAHPTIAKLVQGVMMLVPALTLLLSPLAVGIGLTGGFLAAWNTIWMLIGPLVTGLAAMSATVWLVAAAIVGLTAGFMYLWNTNEGFRNAIISAWTNIQSVLTVAMTAIKEAMINSWNTIKGSVTPVLEALKNLFSSLLPILQPLVAFIAGALVVAWTIAISIFTAVIAAIGPLVAAFMNLVAVVVNVVAAIVAVLTGDFDAAYLYWNAATQAAIDLFKNLWDGIVAFITTFASTFVDILTAMADAAGLSISGMVENITTFFQNLWDTCVELATSLAEGVTAAWEVMSTGVQDVLTGLGTAISGAWTTFTTSISTALTAIGSAISTGWETFTSTITGALSTIGSAISTAWETMTSTITGALSTIGSAISTAWSTITTTVSTASTTISTAVSTAWTAVTTAVTTAVSAVSSAVSTGFSAISSAVTTASSTVSSAVSTAWSTVSSAVTTAVSTASSAVSTGFSAMVTAVGSAMSGVLTAVTSGWNSAVSFLRGINLASIGRNIIQGLVNGINGMMGAVSSAISRIASKVKSGLASALKIHSPSRWMRDEIGANIVSGIVVGIQQKELAAVQAASNLGASITDAFTPQLSVAGVDVSRSSLDAGLQMDDIKQQIKDELDVDLWVHGEGGNSQGQTSYEGMFSGAQFVVREEADIEKIARKLQQLQRSANRQVR